VSGGDGSVLGVGDGGVKAWQKKSRHKGLRVARETGLRRIKRGRESTGSQGEEGSNSSDESYRTEDDGAPEDESESSSGESSE
jgi:hypothetical protein